MNSLLAFSPAEVEQLCAEYDDIDTFLSELHRRAQAFMGQDMYEPGPERQFSLSRTSSLRSQSCPMPSASSSATEDHFFTSSWESEEIPVSDSSKGHTSTTRLRRKIS